MRWIFALFVVAASAIFMYYEYRAMSPSNGPVAAPPPPALEEAGPAPLLDAEELKVLHKSAEDPDSGVRWSAIELLYTIKDPDSLKILEKTVSEDTDVEVRMKAVHLLNTAGTSRQVPALVKALSDIDKDVRLAALKALGDIGDPSAASWVSALLKDPEDEVRTEALHTLGRFQDKRMQQFKELTEQLRRQYEAAVKKSQQNAQ